jgi:hypothetical protein
MQLIEDLERRAAREESMFQAQILREDIARLRRLQEMARSLEHEEFLDKGMRVGWTQGDARTAELREPLQALLDALYGFEKGNLALEARIAESWHALHRMRMERLLGCLSTPAPRLAD